MSTNALPGGSASASLGPGGSRGYDAHQEQSRQATENKSPGSEAQGPGGAEESETGEATLPGDGPRSNEETSNPVVRPNQPPGALPEP